jgi:DNA-binding transcriptional ArsR family regulator
VSSERNDTKTPQPAERAEATEQTETGEDVLTLTDPRMMRALAHPLRIAILELFAVQETLTATQVSEALGESPANCAFHLRTLGKYGVIQEAGGGRGRERPWKEVSSTIRVSTSGLNDKQAELAATALGQVALDRWLSRIKNAFSKRDWPAEWEDGSEAHESVVYLTPAEMVRISEDIRVLFHPYLSRRKDPSLRPSGALPVEFDVFAFLRQDLAALVPDTDENGPSEES